MKKGISKYYKRTFDDYQVLVQVNPEDYSGIELIIHPSGKIEKTIMDYDEEIYDDLKVDEFEPCSPLEFNLFLKGVK
ncbi:hypothetical protein QWY93_13045 [Echinicola jeungdonensis]|uniref:Uncharacterized protein n=1 Tax=Echinicola jeungdonensis TaxID=709343 RepID=A0ABV5J8U8_9BACT|nr:hypothetical protein [Echinicola jeungdonensis]MDN3670251.1 hypothetical protein [Echinicola jeungdonensis]